MRRKYTNNRYIKDKTISIINYIYDQIPQRQQEAEQQGKLTLTLTYILYNHLYSVYLNKFHKGSRKQSSKDNRTFIFIFIYTVYIWPNPTKAAGSRAARYIEHSSSYLYILCISDQIPQRQQEAEQQGI